MLVVRPLGHGYSNCYNCYPLFSLIHLVSSRVSLGQPSMEMAEFLGQGRRCHLCSWSLAFAPMSRLDWDPLLNR